MIFSRLHGQGESDFGRITPSIDPFSPLLVANSAVIYHTGLSSTFQDTSGTTPAGISDPVAYVQDLTTNLRHGKIGVSTRRPQKQAAIFGAQPGLYFTGDDVLEVTANLWSQSGGSLWLVFKTDTIDASTFRRVLSVRKGTDYDFDQQGAYTVTAGPTSSQSIGLASGIGAPNSMGASVAYTNSTAYLFQAHFSGGSLTAKMAGTTSNDTYTVTDTMTPSWFTIGAQRIAGPNYQEFFSGWLGYVHVTTSIASAAEQAGMESYILSQFGVAA